MYFRYPAWVVGDLLSTPLWFAFFALSIFLFAPPGEFSSSNIGVTLNYFFWGFVFVAIFNTTLSGIGQYMLTEQITGTIEQIFLAPMNRLTLVAGRWARAMITDLIVVVSTAVFLELSEHVGISFVKPLQLVWVLILLEIGLLGLGLILASVGLRFKGFVTAMNYAWIVIIIFSGVFFPITALPRAFLILSLLLPSTYYVDLIKHYGVGTASLMNSGIELALITATSAALLIIGWYVFGWMEKAVKNRGKLGSF